ncbi:hypothetical protein DAEQUDRAFT_229663 [Daedalea quercina L-15889]|uniref:Uncharacterized protein n=1 Tax=Daedalea quercina L-15889 TaxID=1314783 RepID=A0A165KGQ5_9APHY|nr:hypothetical protein DAEQUDRAFT_229663 [Daedalea quercina L-15889]
MPQLPPRRKRRLLAVYAVLEVRCLGDRARLQTAPEAYATLESNRLACILSGSMASKLMCLRSSSEPVYTYLEQPSPPRACVQASAHPLTILHACIAAISGTACRGCYACIHANDCGSLMIDATNDFTESVDNTLQYVVEDSGVRGLYEYVPPSMVFDQLRYASGVSNIMSMSWPACSSHALCREPGATRSPASGCRPAVSVTSSDHSKSSCGISTGFVFAN